MNFHVYSKPQSKSAYKKICYSILAVHIQALTFKVDTAPTEAKELGRQNIQVSILVALED